METYNNPLLLLTTVPFISGAVCLFLPDRFRLISRGIALIVTAASLAGSVSVFINKPVYWQNGPVRTLIADSLSAFIAVAIAVFAFLVTIYSFGFITRSIGRYFGYLLMTLGSAFGVAYANDFMTLLICWGVIAVTLFLLVNLRGTEEASMAAKKAIIIIGGTDALMLFGVALIWSMSGTFYIDSIHIEIKGLPQLIAYLSVMAAAFAKAGAMPLGSWLPDVAEASPAPVAAYLPASLDKLLGIYLLARLSLDVFVTNAVSNTILLIAGSVTIVLAVIFALVQHDLKRLLGYHAVSQVGYMIVGIGTGNPIGIAGGLFHMLNNAIYKSCLFLTAGSVEKRTGTTDLAKLGALARHMPITFAAFLVASLSISGIPPFNGFFSKWMIYQGIIKTAGPENPLWIVWLVCAMFGSALTIASFMKLLHAVFLGRPSTGGAGVKEVNAWMWLPAVTLACLCVILGVFAFQFPLPVLILPSIGRPAVYLGLWHPIVAAALLAIGLAVGTIAYFISRQGPIRASTIFIGGEEPEMLGRISGTEFYDTIKDIKVLDSIYRKEEGARFDLYYIFRKTVYFFTGILERLHNGILPTYMVWCLLGMAVMFLVLMVK